MEITEGVEVYRMAKPESKKERGQIENVCMGHNCTYGEDTKFEGL
jgi:hypothetical protein